MCGWQHEVSLPSLWGSGCTYLHFCEECPPKDIFNELLVILGLCAKDTEMSCHVFLFHQSLCKNSPCQLCLDSGHLNKILWMAFPQLGGWAVQVTVPAHLVPGEGSLPGLQTVNLLDVSSCHGDENSAVYLVL